MLKRVEMGMLGIKAKHDAVGRYITGIGLLRTPNDLERSAGGNVRFEIFGHYRVETRPPIATDVDIHGRRPRRADTDNGGASNERDRLLNVPRQGNMCRGHKVFETYLDGAANRGNTWGKGQRWRARRLLIHGR